MKWQVAQWLEWPEWTKWPEWLNGGQEASQTIDRMVYIVLHLQLFNVILSGHYGDMSKDEHIELLQMKDEEIDGMKNEILKEQQVNSHVHMVQEKEILDKDRAITFLNKQLTIKQKEVDCLRKLNKKVAGNQ